MCSACLPSRHLPSKGVLQGGKPSFYQMSDTVDVTHSQHQNPDLAPLEDVGNGLCCVGKRFIDGSLGLESEAYRAEVPLSFGESKITVLAPPY